MTLEAAALNKPHYDDKGYDTYVSNVGHRVFGVFDGMGVSEGARSSANLAAALFEKNATLGLDAAGLAGLIDQASKSISVHFPHDGTTATIVRVDSDGKLHYAHVGDSRLYIMNDDRIKQITADEGIGNRLTNYCGPFTHGCCQMGIIHEDDWDMFMLCSDGITGDWREQQLSDEEIEMVLREYNGSDACQKLYQLSKKDDDKTVIVVGK